MVDDVAIRCQTEHLAVRRAMEALRVTLNWKAPTVALPRKLSSVAFIIRALQRHLERQISLEEDGGYMKVVKKAKPNLTDQAERLHDEHVAFREALRELIPNIERLKPADEELFDQVCEDIIVLLERIDEHDLAEAELLQETFIQDEGGEG